MYKGMPVTRKCTYGSKLFLWRDHLRARNQIKNGLVSIRFGNRWWIALHSQRDIKRTLAIGHGLLDKHGVVLAQSNMIVANCDRLLQNVRATIFEKGSSREPHCCQA